MNGIMDKLKEEKNDEMIKHTLHYQEIRHKICVTFTK